MSVDSLAAFRKSLGDDLGQLAEEHYRHDLNETDRATLQSAAKRAGTHATIGSLLGLGLGIYMAYRIRSNRVAMFNAFKTSEKPTHVQFANGRQEAIPDLTPFLKPSTLGDVAAYTFFAGGGLFFGGELGLLTGSWSASSTIARNPDSKKRIETAFRKFRAEMLRAQAGALDKGDGKVGSFGL